MSWCHYINTIFIRLFNETEPTLLQLWSTSQSSPHDQPWSLISSKMAVFPLSIGEAKVQWAIDLDWSWFRSQIDYSKRARIRIKVCIWGMDKCIAIHFYLHWSMQDWWDCLDFMFVWMSNISCRVTNNSASTIELQHPCHSIAIPSVIKPSVNRKMILEQRGCEHTSHKA